MTKVDIQERTLDYGVRIVRFCLKLYKNYEYRSLTRQLMRSGTSVGANMEEADGASSKKDFIHKVSIAYKEIKETVYWFKIIKQAELLSREETLNELGYLFREGEEIRNILCAILKKSRGQM